MVHIPLKGFVVPLSFPTTRLSTGKADRELVEVDLVDSFASIDERQLKERLDFEVLGSASTKRTKRREEYLERHTRVERTSHRMKRHPGR